MRKNSYFLCLMLTVACVLSGCGQGNAATANVSLEIMDTSEMFSGRDKEIGYDETTSVQITLEGDSATASTGSVEISGSTVKITEEGTYVITGTLNNGSIIIEVPDSDKVQLVLNEVTVNSDNYAAIYVIEADKVFITTAAESVNKLSNSGEFVQTDDNSVDGVIFSKTDLTLNGAGTLGIETAYGHGVVSKDDLVIASGDYDISASGHGLAGKDSVRIASGDCTINVGKDAIQASNTEDSEKGFVYIAGGTLEIAAGDDAVHAETKLLVEGGDINITKCYEGLEALNMDINGGTVTIVASDDGLNAAGGNDQSGNERGWAMMDTNEEAYINISGGTLHVNAQGDGLDSNGYLYVSGGETYISGPTNSGNGALDYALDAQISGGTFVATGMSGMAMNFGYSSSQGAILNNYSASLEAGSVVELKDLQGNVLLNYTTEKNYNSVVVSCPGIKVGESYTLTTGSESIAVEMSEIIYGGTGGFGGMNSFGGGKGGFGDFGGFGGKDGGNFGKEKGNRGEKGERPEMPEGGFPNGEMSEMPEGGFPNGEMPEMPEGGFPNGEMPEMPNGSATGEQTPNA